MGLKIKRKAYEINFKNEKFIILPLEGTTPSQENYKHIQEVLDNDTRVVQEIKNYQNDIIGYRVIDGFTNMNAILLDKRAEYRPSWQELTRASQAYLRLGVDGILERIKLQKSDKQ